MVNLSVLYMMLSRKLLIAKTINHVSIITLLQAELMHAFSMLSLVLSIDMHLLHIESTAHCYISVSTEQTVCFMHYNVIDITKFCSICMFLDYSL